ncbi:divergent protein kinase domain 1C isoform X2 [Lasioglossum baleicum]|uniref:divergent protein kinase domain 1C isoform X2 n=1 Tax=Lasioglossum baleicum TaxID=434251 RepID=UPI003FCE9126
MNVRRLPGFIYHYKVVTLFVFSLSLLVVYLLLHWGIMCTNLEAWRHVSNVCSTHRKGAAIGILCDPLCAQRGIHSLACETLHAGKEAVFSAHWEATRLVFKASRTKTPVEQYESLYWTDTSGTKHFPSEEDFCIMIRDLVVSKLNVTLSGHQLERLARLRTHRVETEPTRRQLEMENLWPLLQENEYLMSILYEDRDIFPQLIGGQKLKFLDLDAAFPKTIISRITADRKSCERHEDCDYFDCRSVCSKDKRCESPVLNNNLQIVCEKIFLGWTLSGTIIIPGLLMSEHTTSTLAVMLRQCANPAGDIGHLPRAAVPDNLKTRLYNMLHDMEQEIAASL